MSHDLIKIWQISVDISKTVQDRDILTVKNTCNRKSYYGLSNNANTIKFNIVTLNDPESDVSYLTLFNSLFRKYDTYTY